MWFHSSEFMKVAAAIHKAATTVHTHWLERSKIKYMSLYIDQRTGDFIVKDRDGEVITQEELLEIFPELND